MKIREALATKHARLIVESWEEDEVQEGLWRGTSEAATC